MRCEIVGSASREDWDEAVTGCPWATFFHTPVWAEVLTQTFSHYEIATPAFRYEDGNLAVLPLLRLRLLEGLYWYESMVPGVYGGPVFKTEPRSQHYEPIWEYLRTLSDVEIMGNPFASWTLEGFATRPLFTQYLRLDSGYEAVRRGFSKGHRAAIKYAARQGVEVRVVGSPEDFDAYYAIYQASLRRWGKNASGFYPRQLFRNLAARPEVGDKIRLWLASVGSRVVSGALVFYHNHHAVYWHGATLGECFSYRPVHLTVAMAIEDACQRGYEYFDFNPSGGYQGVVAFKEHFGTQRLYFQRYRRSSPLGLLYRMRRLVMGRLRRCPLD